MKFMLFIFTLLTLVGCKHDKSDGGSHIDSVLAAEPVIDTAFAEYTDETVNSADGVTSMEDGEPVQETSREQETALIIKDGQKDNAAEPGSKDAPRSVISDPSTTDRESTVSTTVADEVVIVVDSSAADEEQIATSGDVSVSSEGTVVAKVDTETVLPEETIDESISPTAVDGPVSHSSYDKLLRQYVSDKGTVNYAGLKSDLSELEAYLASLSAVAVDSWPRAEQLAYWINVYNAFTLRLILDNYPINSITDLHMGKPWDVQWISIGDKTYSLNNIEHDIIRPRFSEPRIHFAVNCAAKSCPPLANQAYTADNLESMLEKQTRQFINNADYNELEEKKWTLSKIFDWYGVDFPDLITFIRKHTEKETIASPAISYLEYDWSLNDK